MRLRIHVPKMIVAPKNILTEKNYTICLNKIPLPMNHSPHYFNEWRLLVCKETVYNLKLFHAMPDYQSVVSEPDLGRYCFNLRESNEWNDRFDVHRNFPFDAMSDPSTHPLTNPHCPSHPYPPILHSRTANNTHHPPPATARRPTTPQIEPTDSAHCFNVFCYAFDSLWLYVWPCMCLVRY